MPLRRSAALKGLVLDDGGPGAVAERHRWWLRTLGLAAFIVSGCVLARIALGVTVVLLAVLHCAVLLAVIVERGAVPVGASSRGDRRPIAGPILLGSALVLLLHAERDLQLIALEPLALDASVVGVVVLLVVVLSRDDGLRWPDALSMAFVAGVAATAMLAEFDVRADRAAPERRPERIAEVFTNSTKRGPVFHVRLERSGRVLTVSRSLHDRMHRGDAVTLLVHPGRLAAPWWSLEDPYGVPGS